MEVDDRIALLGFLLLDEPTMKHQTILGLYVSVIKWHAAVARELEASRVVLWEFMLLAWEIGVVEHLLLHEVDHDQHDQEEDQG